MTIVARKIKEKSPAVSKAKRVSLKNDDQNEQGILWQALGIKDKPEHQISWRLENGLWPNVITDKGVQRADIAMKEYNQSSTITNRIGDSGIGVGGGYSTGYVNIDLINSLAIDNVFLGWGELSLLQQNNLINNFCTIFADCFTSKWIKFRSKDKTKEDKIRRLEKRIVHFKLKEKLNVALQRMMLLGTVYVSPKIKGDEDDLREPLLFDSIKLDKGCLEDIYIIEPTWVVPLEFNMVNPRAPNFYKPQAYVVYGTTLHASRMRRMVYIEPTNLVSPMYLFGGQPWIQSILPYILDFLNTKKQLVQIVSRFNISILQTDMSNLHGTNGYAKGTTLAGNAKGRAAAFNAVRNNFGLYMINKEEEFTQIQINTTGLPDILQQQAEFLSLFSRIPISKLFGQAAKGLNATGEFDANNFNELIRNDQEAKIRPTLTYCIDLIQMDEFGEIDADIEYDFVPLGELNETAQSALKDGKVNRATALVNAGMADPVKLMDVLVNDPDLELDDYNTAGDENLGVEGGENDDNE